MLCYIHLVVKELLILRSHEVLLVEIWFFALYRKIFEFYILTILKPLMIESFFNWHSIIWIDHKTSLNEVLRNITNLVNSIVHDIIAFNYVFVCILNSIWFKRRPSEEKWIYNATKWPHICLIAVANINLLISLSILILCL